MVKRITPEEDIERINERLRSFAAMQIQDRDSYDLSFNSLFGQTEAGLSSQQKTLRGNAFEKFVDANPNVSKERIFKKARGKDLARDRRTTAKRIVTTRKEFEKAGATRVDLKGFDTKRQKFTKQIAQRRVFTVPARIKDKVVFTQRTFVVVKGKKMLRFRDSKGRFGSVK